MNSFPDNHDKLERLIHRSLRELPPRRAPHSLEARVLAELERRAALPWWRKSFGHWPMAARLAFAPVGAGAVALAMYFPEFVQAGFDSGQLTRAFAPAVAWLDSARGVASLLGDFCGNVIQGLPPLWLYGGLAFVSAMYVALFGLGAAAYRTLYANR